MHPQDDEQCDPADHVRQVPALTERVFSTVDFQVQEADGTPCYCTHEGNGSFEHQELGV